VDFRLELSIICARASNGAIECFPPAENVHEDHILDMTLMPGQFPGEVRMAAMEFGQRIAESMGVIGLIAVEMFLTRDGRLLINEIAPRPHNSGHWTLDACMTSQFEQHVRAVCGLPLGAPLTLSSVVMMNLLGDLWKNGEPDWKNVLRDPRAKLHLYGKTHPRPKRKMGHVNVLSEHIDDALARAQRIKAALGG
jgi:5-(carboxyamino)imidazole ribonucleotide synthase